MTSIRPRYSKAALFATLRVLGIQFHPQEGVRLARVNTSLLQQDGRPVWLVVRPTAA